jgi:DNA repair exonuclease SbcCD nuclease subunit
MKIDILSDLHFDYHFKDYPSQKDIREKFDPVFGEERGDVLVVAGDIGHNNDQNRIILKMLQKYYYKYIVCVLGNHDYYLKKVTLGKYDFNSLNRVQEMRDMINSIDNMYCLNGNVIEIDGVKFGGADGWYSRAFLKAHYPLADDSTRSINEMWKNCMPDYGTIYLPDEDGEGTKNINFDDILTIELPKIEAVYQKCDVMITHINPSFLKEHVHKDYSNYPDTTFFSFDGHKYLRNGSMKYWIFGHDHDSREYEFEGVKCITSCFGNMGEARVTRQIHL